MARARAAKLWAAILAAAGASAGPAAAADWPMRCDDLLPVWGKAGAPWDLRYDRVDEGWYFDMAGGSVDGVVRCRSGWVDDILIAVRFHGNADGVMAGAVAPLLTTMTATPESALWNSVRAEVSLSMGELNARTFDGETDPIARRSAEYGEAALMFTTSRHAVAIEVRPPAHYRNAPD